MKNLNSERYRKVYLFKLRRKEEKEPEIDLATLFFIERLSLKKKDDFKFGTGRLLVFQFYTVAVVFCFHRKSGSKLLEVF